ncbi:MAG TPA: alpha/beta hydrolase, partial [Amnibacterium sp.]
RDGQRIAWQRFGRAGPTLLLLPTWSIVHSDFWRAQVAHLAPRHRVIAFDGLGNGASDRPTDVRYYGDLPVAEDAVRVLDACGIESAVVLGVSQGGPWALALAALHPERVRGAVFIAPNVPLAPGHADRVAASRRFLEVLDDHPGWLRWNRDHWLRHYEDFLRFFFEQCFPEPDSEEQIEHFLRMGLETTPEVLLATSGTEEATLTEERAIDAAGRVRCPSLVIHGDEDRITPLARGEALARLAGSELLRLPGSGHEPQYRIPEVVNRQLDAFLESIGEGGRG